MDSIIEWYITYDNPITDIQHGTLLFLMAQTGIQVDIANLTYGSAGEVIWELFQANR